MKNKLTMAIFGILLIGIVSAGLVNYLSNTITGSVEVKGPVFYLSNGTDNGTLLLNNPPQKGGSEIIFTSETPIYFISDELGINELYNANFTMKVWISTNVNGSALQFQIFKINSTSSETICSSPEINITLWYDEHRKRETFCTSSNNITFYPNDKLGLVIIGITQGSNYSIVPGNNYTNGNYSRIEINPV